MPDARLERTRSTLPDGYRFGDGAPYRNGTPCRWCIRMCGDSCAKRGCLRRQYERGSISALPSMDWFTDPRTPDEAARQRLILDSKEAR